LWKIQRSHSDKKWMDGVVVKLPKINTIPNNCGKEGRRGKPPLQKR